MCGMRTCTTNIGRNSCFAKKYFAWNSTTVYPLFRPCDLISLKSYSIKLLQSNYFKFRLEPFNFLPAFWHTTARKKFCPSNPIRIQCGSQHCQAVLLLVKPNYVFSSSFLLTCSKYRGSPTYAVFTTADPTTTVFGLCTCKWGIFVLVGDLLQSH